MAKEKKILVKHYHNTKLKPIEDGDNLLYPIYTKVNYDRKNTKFLIDWKTYFYEHRGIEEDWSEFAYVSVKDFEKITKAIDDEKRPKGIIGKYGTRMYEHHDSIIELHIRFSEIITSLIRFEIEKDKSNFSLKGFGKRMKRYVGNVIYDFGEKILNDLILELKPIAGRRFIKMLENPKALFYKKFELLNKNPKVFQMLSDKLIFDIEAYFVVAFFCDTRTIAFYHYHWFISPIKDEFLEFYKSDEADDLFYQKYLKHLNPSSQPIQYFSRFQQFINE